MATAVEIINIGLSKVAASSRVSSITPPVTPLEQFMAANYPHYKRLELTMNSWRFAYEIEELTLEGAPLDGEPKPYRYAMPNAALMPVRRENEEWEQRGVWIYSAYDRLRVAFRYDRPESDFPAHFVEALACRVALDSNEYTNQSNTKFETRERWYTDAINKANQANAIIRGEVKLSDENNPRSGLTWVQDREGFA